MPTARFLLLDLVGAVPNVAVLVGLGFYFSNRLKMVSREVTRVERVAGASLLVMIAVVVALVFWRRRIAGRKASSSIGA